MRRSLYPSGVALKALSVTDVSADGATNGDTVDRYQASGDRGSYHGGVLFVALAGTVSDGTYTLSVEESDTGSGWAAASDYDTQGSGVLDTSNTVAELGYNGTKRYCRLVVTAADTTEGATVAAVAYLDGGQHRAV